MKQKLIWGAFLELFWNYLMNFLLLNILNISNFRPILVFYFKNWYLFQKFWYFSILKKMIPGVLEIYYNRVRRQNFLLIANYVTKLGPSSKFWDFLRSKIEINSEGVDRNFQSHSFEFSSIFTNRTIFHLKI